MNNDEKGKNRLRTFALERWEVERVDGQARANAITILIMLHHLGVDIAPLIPEARGWAGADGFLTGEVNDVESVVSGKLDALNLARDVLALDWKANAKRVAARIGAKHD